MRKPNLRQVQLFVKVHKTIRRLGIESIQLTCLQKGREQRREQQGNIANDDSTDSGDWLAVRK